MTARRSFSNDKAAVGEARRFVSQVLDEGHPDALVETAVLLTSEVVSNAVLHGRSAPTVAVSLDADRVRVEVDDASPALPVRKHYGPEATTGRGLMLLETLAVRWGAELIGSGKRVWFDLEPAAQGTPAVEGGLAVADRTTNDLDDLDDLAASFGEVGGSSAGGVVALAVRTHRGCATRRRGLRGTPDAWRRAPARTGRPNRREETGR